MKLSRRAKRMQRHYKRMHKPGGLNLVSLMDIFTILVFFLMVNSSDVQVLQQDKSVSLPLSTVEQQPKENLRITIAPDHILVQGRPVAQIASIGEEEIIAALKEELLYQAKRQVISNEGSFNGYDATIIADREAPYKLLKKVMATCTEAKFTNISLAVERKFSKGEGA